MKLPPPGGRSDRRTEGGLSRSGDGARPQGRGCFRGLGQREPGVLEGPARALPGLSGGSAPDRRSLSGSACRTRGGSGQVQPAGVQVSAMTKRAATSTNKKVVVPTGTARVDLPDEGVCMLKPQTWLGGHLPASIHGYHSFRIRGGDLTNFHGSPAHPLSSRPSGMGLGGRPLWAILQKGILTRISEFNRTARRSEETPVLRGRPRAGFGSFGSTSR